MMEVVNGSGGSPEAALQLTEELFQVAIEDLNETFVAIREGRIEAAKDGRHAVKMLSELSFRVLEERRNVEKFRKNIAGSAGGWGELDLEAARNEIGLRLARLRNARGD